MPRPRYKRKVGEPAPAKTSLSSFIKNYISINAILMSAPILALAIISFIVWDPYLYADLSWPLYLGWIRVVFLITTLAGVAVYIEEK